MTLPTTPDETGRIDALRALRVLDTPPEAVFEDLARLAASLCSAPVAAVSLVDVDRQWDKAVVGLPHAEVPREHAFAARAILAPGGLLEVTDTHADAAWADNPQVTGRPWIRSYAGAAIVTGDGHAVGAIGVAGHQAHRLPPHAADGLRALARQAAVLLELRRQATWLVQANVELRRQALEDPVTGLVTRTVLHDRLEQALRTRARTHREVGVVFCDLDAHRAVDDHLGPERAVELLQLVTDRLTGVARGSDTLARFGGHTFVLLCTGLASAQDVELVRARLRAAVERPVTLGGTSFVPRLSIGAVVAGAAEEAESVLRRADAAADAARRAAYA